jgi:hypothetical protein
MPRGRLTIMLLCLLAGGVAAGCSTMTTRTAGPRGCCCTYANCRADLSQPECAKEGEFQGWTSTWHPAPATSTTPIRHPTGPLRVARQRRPHSLASLA